MKNQLPKLTYAYDALEPHIDETTMKIHHTKHHQAYVDKLNAALESEGIDEDAQDLLKDISKVPLTVRQAVINNGGGHVNHSFFWPLLKKGVRFSGEIKKAIEKNWGTFEAFKEEFSETAASLFGSGWTWLVVDNGELQITTTPNQYSPLTDGASPVLALDVWEHAYYLKYQNRRLEYIENFFKVINWDKVNEHYINATR